MKTAFTLLFNLILTATYAQSLNGAWQLTKLNGKPVSDREVIAIYQDDYFAFGAKETKSNNFLYAAGGIYKLEGNTYSETRDFDTQTPEKIGENFSFSAELFDDNLTLTDSVSSTTWKRISSHRDSLTHNWVITGRMQKEEISRNTPGDRRTIKILSGGRFQWVAFNSATKTFNGTGGGTYTANDGIYTENISFFSRDVNRVGAILKFEFEIKGGEWHLKGKSSKGDSIYEIWSVYKEAFQKE
jgi:hypothetical protein